MVRYFITRNVSKQHCLLINNFSPFMCLFQLFFFDNLFTLSLNKFATELLQNFFFLPNSTSHFSFTFNIMGIYMCSLNYN